MQTKFWENFQRKLVRSFAVDILYCSSLVQTLIDIANYQLNSNGKEACKNNSGRVAEANNPEDAKTSWYVLVSTLFALRSCLHSHVSFQPFIAAMGFEHA